MSDFIRCCCMDDEAGEPCARPAVVAVGPVGAECDLVCRAHVGRVKRPDDSEIPLAVWRQQQERSQAASATVPDWVI